MPPARTNPSLVPEENVHESKVPVISSCWCSRGKVLFPMIQSSRHWITNSFTLAFQISEMDPSWKTNESWLHPSVQIPASWCPLSLFHTKECALNEDMCALVALSECISWYTGMTNGLRSSSSTQRVKKKSKPQLTTLSNRNSESNMQNIGSINAICGGGNFLIYRKWWHLLKFWLSCFQLSPIEV